MATLTGSLGVEAGESVPDDVIRICAVEFLTEKCKEHGEVDRSRRLGDHLVKIGLSRVLTKGGEHFYQVIFVNKAIPILVNHVEGFL